MEQEVIYVVVGEEKAERRFNDFYAKSILLAKENLLTSFNKASLVLKMEHFDIRFVPNTKIDMLRGLNCHWAYGFSPEFTQFLEFRASEKMKESKPLVENLDELFERLIEMDKQLKGGISDG